MKRRLFTITAALSLLLCAATVVLWATIGEEKQSALARVMHPDTTEWGAWLRLAVAVTPYWLVVALTSLLPGLWLAFAAISRITPSPGSCSRCGYDLRATPERCPECGTEAKAITR